MGDVTDLRPVAVNLDCGCRPLFRDPYPFVGDRLSCLFHQRGATVVAVERRGKPKRIYRRVNHGGRQWAAAVQAELDREETP